MSNNFNPLLTMEKRNCIKCGREFIPSSRKQGGGARQIYCSRKCGSLAWVHIHKEEVKLTKQKSAAKESCRKRKRLYSQSKQIWKRYTPEYRLWSGARTRAKEKQLDFTIQLEDVKIPSCCPLLGFPLITGRKHCAGDSPSVDRIDSKQGYVPGNVWVISHRANTVKSDLSLSQLKQLIENLELIIIERKIHEDRY